MHFSRIAIIAGTVGLALGLALFVGERRGQAEDPEFSAGSSVATPTPPEIPPNLQEALRPSYRWRDQIASMTQGPLPAPLGAPQPTLRGPSTAGVAAGVDVIVNDPFVQPGELQSEVTLAVRDSTICAAYIDTSGRGLSRSPDFGATWTDLGRVGPRGGDPALAVHQASGTFFYGHLALIDGLSAIGVARSTDDCQSFSALANASPTVSNASDGQDKVWIAVDNSGGPYDGNVYVCWTRAIPGPPDSADVWFSRSTDGGVTFGDEQAISVPIGSFTFGCDVDVGPAGEVYVAWADSNVLTSFPIRIRRSLDGGATFPEPPVQVNSAPIRHAGFDRPVECPAQTRATLNGDIRMIHTAWMAVDTTGGPFDGNIYVAWMHDPFGLIDNSDIFLSYSTDGGLTWAPEVQIAGGTETDQFHPFVEVGGEGTVSIVWYDRRNDPVNNWDIDVYTTFSTDGGVTLRPISQLNDVTFPPVVFGCYMGEYIAGASDANAFYYAWGDNRNGDPDVYFDKQAIPPLASSTPTATPTPPPPVGGVAVGSDVAELPLESVSQSSSGGRVLIVLAMGAVAVFVALGSAHWYTRRP